MLHNRFFPCVAPLSTLIADAGTKPLSWPTLQLGGAAKPSRPSSCWILLSNIHRKRRVSFSVPTDRDVGRLGLAHWALCQVPGTRQRATNRLRSLGPARMQLEKDFTPTQHPWTLPPSEDNCPLCLVAVDVLVMYLVHPSLSTSHTHGCRRLVSFVRCTTVVPTSGQQTLLLRSWLMGLAASAILMTRSTQGETPSHAASWQCAYLAFLARVRFTLHRYPWKSRRDGGRGCSPSPPSRKFLHCSH